jgi:ferrous iron transport protein A
VTELRIDGPARRRLLDLGFVSGTIVRAVRRSPLGDPTAYEVRGSILAVRREDAARILVQPVGTT